jgi:pimeloyl-ACP methyl ester carboxylesterase
MVRRSSRRSKSAPRRSARRNSPPNGPANELPKVSRSAPLPGAWRLSDVAIERSLLTKENAVELDLLFGNDGHTELARLAAQASGARRSLGGKVLILPDVMGSTLGVKDDDADVDHDDVYWLDPSRFDFTVAKKLALSHGRSVGAVRPLGVIASTYQKLKYSLQIEGYDAEFFPYDWRIHLGDLGASLKARLRELGKGVQLVAHGMGGLVARAAIEQGGKVDKLIMLGTPNRGSFVSLQIARGVHPTIKKLAALDLQDDPEKLAEIFASFTGLCQLLPFGSNPSAVSGFDSRFWPKRGTRPPRDVLRQALGVQDLLAAGDDRFHLIVGVNQKTVVAVNLSHDKSEFEYGFSPDGDGTVPRQFAELSGVKATYYVDELHGSLPNNGLVVPAVADILSTGSTARLPDHREASRAAAPSFESESALRAPAFEGQPRGQLRVSQQRELLCDFAAPLSPSSESQAPQATEATTTPIQEDLFKALTISRVRQHRLEIHLANGSITDVQSRAYVLGLFREVTPGGAAREIDRIMNGAVTEFTQRRMFGSNVGEIFIAPAARTRLRADLVLFAGLGTFDGFNDEVQQIVAENVMRTLLRTNVEELATVMFGAGSGASIASALRNLLQGFLRAKLDADGDKNFRRITFCELDPERFRELRREAYRLASTPLFENVEVSFTDLEKIQPTAPAMDVPAAARQAAAKTVRDPLYLMVRVEGQDAKKLSIRTSLLPPTSKAVILTDLKSVERGALESHLARIESVTFGSETLPDFGETLTRMILPDSIRTVLPNYQDHHLVIVHDREAGRFPWETMTFTRQKWTPAITGGMSHRYLAENMSVAKFLESRRERDTLDILLIVDPTETLKGALRERDNMLKLAKHQGVRIEKIEGRREGTRKAIEKAISSGKFDVVHFAGHARFDPKNPSNSGILCADQDVLSGLDLSRLSQLPNLAFFNACESARLRNFSVLKVKEQLTHFAEAFLRGGIANFVGTYWPVQDSAAEKFDLAFYEALIRGACLGDVMLEARQSIQSMGVDWADYIHYGDYRFEVKRRPTQGA